MVYEDFYKFVAAFALFIIIFGTISNTMTLIICLRKNMRKIPTFMFIAFASITDTIPLYVRNLDNFSFLVFGIHVRSTNLVLCKINLLLHFFPLHTSAWLLVSYKPSNLICIFILTVSLSFKVVMTIERYLSIRIPVWRKQIFNSKKAIIVAVLVIITLFSLNGILITSPVLNERTVKVNNVTQIIPSCDEGYLASLWTNVSLL